MIDDGYLLLFWLENYFNPVDDDIYWVIYLIWHFLLNSFHLSLPDLSNFCLNLNCHYLSSKTVNVRRYQLREISKFESFRKQHVKCHICSNLGVLNVRQNRIIEEFVKTVVSNVCIANDCQEWADNWLISRIHGRPENVKMIIELEIAIKVLKIFIILDCLQILCQVWISQWKHS